MGAKSGAKTGGRKKGTPNKISADLKESLLESFQRIGSVDYLVEQSVENPVAYLSLLGKVLPKEQLIEHTHKVQTLRILMTGREPEPAKIVEGVTIDG